MNLVGELTFTYRTYRQIASSAIRRIWLFRVIALLLIVCVGSTAVITHELASDVILAMLPALVILALPELVVLVGWRATRRLQPFRYEFSDAGVTVRTSQTSATFQWDGITKVKGYRHAWFLTIGTTRQRVPIPRAAFSPEAQAQLDTYLTGLPGLH